MIEKEIKHIAYRLKQLKDKNNRAIVFVGAGCSISAGIPRASVIANYIKEKHVDNPDVADQISKEGIGYTQLMDCLHPLERRELFAGYVNRANVNVSHIYLAHLMKDGYVDYIVTTNFDNLALRALALYNIFPPVYDLSNLKDLTTTTLDTQSVIYLHGQHHGLWQLNTENEMQRVAKDGTGTAVNIFSKIANARPWIVLGYSGDDFIFDALSAQGRFDNGLYWVGYKDEEPTARVREKLLNKPNTESYWIKGYDADSFFLKLTAALQLEHPAIFSQPFSFVAQVQQDIVDIEDTETYKDVKQRLVSSRQMVQDAIARYEQGVGQVESMTEAEIGRERLAAELTNILLTEKYEEVAQWETAVLKNGDQGLLNRLAGVYNNWGAALKELAETKGGSEAGGFYQEAIAKYARAVEIKPDYGEAWNNWGIALYKLAATKDGSEADRFYQEAIAKYTRAVEIKPDYGRAWNNWGVALKVLAETKGGSEADGFYQEAFAKYARAVEIEPNYGDAWYNWGIAFQKLAETKAGSEADSLYQEAIAKYARAVQVKPDDVGAWNNWGAALQKLAETKGSSESDGFYQEAFAKYARAVQVKPDDGDTWYNWGNSVMQLMKTKSGDAAQALYLQAEEKLQKAAALGQVYNLACLYAITEQPDKAFPLLEQSLENKEINIAHVAADTDWDACRARPEYIALYAEYGRE